MLNNIGNRDHNSSPPLKPIEEFINSKKDKSLIMNPSATHGNKFYIPSNNT
jgi:hypothetical protein